MEANPLYIVSYRVAGATGRPCCKTKKPKTRTHMQNIDMHTLYYAARSSMGTAFGEGSDKNLFSCYLAISSVLWKSS